jgi:hypothetical protein
MFAVLRAHSSRALAVLTAGAALAVMTVGVTLAATSTGYKACANASHKLALENSSGNCPAHFSKVSIGAQGPKGPTGPAGATGPQGPSGVISMTQYAPNAVPIVAGPWAFLGSPPEEDFTNTDTAAEVTASMQEASSNDGEVFGYLGICYESAAAGSPVTDVSKTAPLFAAAQGYFFDETVSGVVGNLPAGDYYVGLCAEEQENVVNGLASVTITTAQTSSGVSSDGIKAARRAQPRGPNRSPGCR